jgi:DNA repair exonuclease SbcCD ATPase subunit
VGFGISADVEVIKRKIDECIQELNRFKMFSSEARSAIEYLERLKAMLGDLNKQKAQEAIKTFEEMYRRAQPYAMFIPKTMESAKLIKEWLEKKLPELPP